MTFVDVNAFESGCITEYALSQGIKTSRFAIWAIESSGVRNQPFQLFSVDQNDGVGPREFDCFVGKCS